MKNGFTFHATWIHTSYFPLVWPRSVADLQLSPRVREKTTFQTIKCSIWQGETPDIITYSEQGVVKWLCSDSPLGWPLNHFSFPDNRSASTRGQNAVQLQLKCHTAQSRPQELQARSERWSCVLHGCIRPPGLIRPHRGTRDERGWRTLSDPSV